MSRRHAGEFYVGGAWVAPSGKETHTVVNPATEEPLGTIAMGRTADVDRAVAAARAAFPAYAATSREERLALLGRIVEVYKKRFNEMGSAISEEMGAPLAFATRMQAGAGLAHFRAMIDVLKGYPFEEAWGTTLITREPIGVAGLITPWNWPANQVACKVAPALAAGCTMVLKPSEYAPYSALLFAEILHEAGVPPGVFNLVNGAGETVGAALAAHPGIDMISFTGSTRAGIEVAVRAAPTVKRVAQELGGKSPNIILEDADFAKAVAGGAEQCFRNSGQSCNAPTRMLVPRGRMGEAAGLAGAVAERLKVGDPRDPATDVGPLVNARQWARVQAYIEKGMAEGARLVAGGPGKPPGLNKGYYVRPTVFADVTNDMTIAREEIFGPVLSIIGYGSEEEAIQLANDTPYGLAAYVSGEPERARRVARRLRAGTVHVNGAPADIKAPFGGYKQSGNGREWGRFGVEEYLEVKAVMGGAA
jgi:aldehyde dehydrogenase (NAD+)